MLQKKTCPQCGQQLGRFQSHCDVCGASANASAWSGGWRTVALTLLVVPLAVGAVWAARRRMPTATEVHATPAPDPTAGWVRLSAEAGVVPLAVDLAALKELESIPSAKYGVGYGRLTREARVFEVPGDTPARFVKREETHVVVRVRAGGVEREGLALLRWVHTPRDKWTPTVRESDQFYLGDSAKR